MADAETDDRLLEKNLKNGAERVMFEDQVLGTDLLHVERVLANRRVSRSDRQIVRPKLSKGV